MPSMPARRLPRRTGSSGSTQAIRPPCATSTQEIGTGVRTIIPQIAAEVLGVPVDTVSLSLGDTDLPPAPMTAGSTSTLSVGSAVQHAATKLKRQLGAAGNRYDEALAKL